MNDQMTEVADEINCLGLTFERCGWNRQNPKPVAKGNQTLVTIHKCSAKTLIQG
jgi:hypothetical protein